MFSVKMTTNMFLRDDLSTPKNDKNKIKFKNEKQNLKKNDENISLKIKKQ